MSQGSPEVNPIVLIGSYIVRVLLYRVFFVAKASKFNLHKFGQSPLYETSCETRLLASHCQDLG